MLADMELPIPGGDGPLLRPALLAAGFADDELRKLRRSGLLTAIERGAYLDSSDPRLRDRAARHGLLVAAAIPRVAADAVVSHVSAAVLHGLPVWNLPLRRVHVTRPRRTGGGLTGRLHVHTAPLDTDEIVFVGGIAVTSPARTIADIARRAPFEQAVVIADNALYRHLTSPPELAAAVSRADRWPGAPAARRVAEFADGRSESVGESRSRVAIARAGLPPPVPQWEVVRFDGHVLGRVDFAWPKLRVVGEFDGRVKYGRLLRPGQDPGDVVFAEKLREDAIRAEDLRFGRWTWTELDNFTLVAARLFPR